MPGDTLHQINDLYVAIEQLKNEVKPIEKTDIEKYGVIIGASIAVLGSLLTLVFTFIKEMFFNKKAIEKEDRAFSRILYGDLVVLNMELVNMIHKRDLLKIELQVNSLLLNVIDDDKSFRNQIEKNDEQLKIYETLNDKYLKIHNDYMAKVGQYMYSNKKSKLELEIQKFAKNGLSYTVEEISLENLTLSDISKFRKKLLAEYPEFWRVHVNIQTSHILHLIQNNK